MGNERDEVTVRVQRRYLAAVDRALQILGLQLEDTDDADFVITRTVTQAVALQSRSRFASGTGFARIPDKVGAKEILDAYWSADATATDKLMDDVHRKGQQGRGRIHTSITVLKARELEEPPAPVVTEEERRAGEEIWAEVSRLQEPE